MKKLTIKDLKQNILNLESEIGNIDDLEIWIQPSGTPSQPVEGFNYDLVCSDDEKENNRKVFGVIISGDIF